ncbi:MAG: pyridoxal-phosphate dependent enzyme [Synergistaceae bacterium]|nr:threonine synthase [Synergistota bacterium]NLM70502.1 pyridoxal-phosphate dependent enzyme [Synergistaceae bacterium]
MLNCARCGRNVEESSLLWRCSCGGPLEWTPLAPMSRASLRRDPGIWRYAASLPPSDGSRVSLGEGGTPLVRIDWSGGPVWFKLDFLCPTGSYKDRGMACMISRLKELGVSRVIEDSSGNAGASMASYCAAAGIKCSVFVPEYTSGGKCVQILSAGAELVKVPGSREETTRAAERAADEAEGGVFYASHNWSPYFAHGVKTFAFEVWEQLGYAAPDSVLLPVGQGSLALGCSLAFDELLAAGEIDRVPRIYAVQAENCSPLARAFHEGVDAARGYRKKETIAEGISSASPVRIERVLEAVRESGGSVVTCSEGEIWQGFRKLSGMGLYVEPTSAVVGSAIDRLAASGEIAAGERVVALLSGSGLKATDKIMSLFKSPPA